MGDNHRVTPARILLRLQAELRFSGLAAWRGLVRLVNGNDLTHAASIAYYALLSLFPFLLLVISILGSITADEEDRLAVLTFVFRYFPTQFEFVNTQLDAFRQTRVQVGVAGGLALIWASLGVFGAITNAVNEAWGVEKQRSFLRHRMVSFLMLVAGGGVMIVALLFVGAVEVAGASWFGVMLARFQWLQALQSLTFTYAATILLILAVGLIYYFIPNAKTRFRDVWVGAVLTGILWRFAFSGFSWYIGRSGLTLIHGSIAAVVVFLLWIYVSSVILMYGVEFTAAYARMRRRRPDEMPAAPTPRI
ncbi:MAG: YihY/virulence factor BrkB family protein [Acidobacteria bacterium]|nr:YihY/virulence factor BrkB family protein [Acidobacteriota bacterium]